MTVGNQPLADLPCSAWMSTDPFRSFWIRNAQQDQFSQPLALFALGIAQAENRGELLFRRRDRGATGEVKRCEFTMIMQRHIIVAPRRSFAGFKPANTLKALVDHNVRDEPRAARHASEQTALSVSGLVAAVFSGGADAQIRATIIPRLPVNVVDIVPGRGLHYLNRHADTRPRLTARLEAISRRSTIGIGMPMELNKMLVVRCVDDRVKAARRRDIADWIATLGADKAWVRDQVVEITPAVRIRGGLPGLPRGTGRNALGIDGWVAAHGQAASSASTRSTSGLRSAGMRSRSHHPWTVV